MNNIKILSYLLLISLFSSCERKPVTTIEPIIEPIITNNFIFDTTAPGSLVKISYGINANVFLGIKLSNLKSNTDIKIDWGDNEIQMESIDTNSTRFSGLTFGFTHQYKENNKYFVKLLAKNATIKDSLTTTLNIVNKVPKPVADFDFQLSEGGKVRLKNLSSSKDSLVQFQWGDDKTVNRSTSRDAEFIYEINGTYTIFLNVFDSVGQSGVITKKITITNNVINRELSEFRGIIFGKNYEFIENLSDCVSATIGPSPAEASVTKFLSKSLPDQRILISVLGMFRVPATGENVALKQYEIFKNNLKLGVKKVGNTSTTDWNSLVRIETKNEQISKSFTDAPNSQIEIIEVREIDQQKLFPEMYDKAFWVTFKIKADFGNGNNIDGTLKVRYLIY